MIGVSLSVMNDMNFCWNFGCSSPDFVKAVISAAPSITPVFCHSSGRRISISTAPFCNDFWTSWSLACCNVRGYVILIISTSKTNIAFGRIADPAPRAPQPNSGEIVSTRFSPSFMPKMPLSHPLITCPTPRTKLKGAPPGFEPSNTVPSRRRPS